MGHLYGTVTGFFRVKDILEEDAECKMYYQREEPMWTTVYMRDSCCLPVCQCPAQCPSSLSCAAPSCRRNRGLEEWSCREVVANAVCWASERAVTKYFCPRHTSYYRNPLRLSPSARKHRELASSCTSIALSR